MRAPWPPAPKCPSSGRPGQAGPIVIGLGPRKGHVPRYPQQDAKDEPQALRPLQGEACRQKSRAPQGSAEVVRGPPGGALLLGALALGCGGPDTNGTLTKTKGPSGTVELSAEWKYGSFEVDVDLTLV